MKTKTLFMMRKLFATICLLCMISSLSYAQNFRYGFTGGVNLSKPMGDIEPQCQAGLLLGAKGELGIPSVTKGFYTDFGLQLSAKGYKFQYGNMVNTDERHFTENLNYLVVPVHIGYKIECSKSVSLFANVGPYAGVALWGKHKSYRNEKKFHTESDIFSGEYGYKRFDWGCGFNVGVEYAKHFQLSFGADWSLMNVSKTNNYTYKNRSFTFSLGYIL